MQMVERVDHLARALSKEFGWQPNQGTEWDKVAGIFALNTVWLAGPWKFLYTIANVGISAG